jgi:hypothetical protein
MRLNTTSSFNTYSHTARTTKRSATRCKALFGYAINTAATTSGLAISKKSALDSGDKASPSPGRIHWYSRQRGVSVPEILQAHARARVPGSLDTNENIDRNALQGRIYSFRRNLTNLANTNLQQEETFGTASPPQNSHRGSSLWQQHLSVSVGNAAAGLYNFKVSVVKTADAVAAKSPDTITISKDTLSSYIVSATGNVSGIPDKSSQLNGNYTISGVSYNADAGSFTLTATGGSNGAQKFTATVNMNALDTSTTHTITADFTDGTNTFSVAFNLASDAAVNNKN